MSETDVVRLRPYRIRVVAWISAAALLVLFSLIATSLHGPTGQGQGTFQRGDQAAMVGLGVLAALACLLFTRPRVEADARGLRVRNLVGSYDLPWEVVRAVRFNRGTPWATLELYDDDTLPMLAVQAADKERAVAGVRSLRTLHERHRADAL
ncbi:PH domain-containing protein [Plantactinospora sp. GCM10030261]|uniref:PH domain-containing protein n=1 Tax=Plantactinospora sp. GCM10030261 TaxID=3273420 RepID=UPI0036214ACC